MPTKLIITLPEGIIHADDVQHNQEMLKNLIEEDIITQWLMACGRRQEAADYQQYFLPRFEEEARQARMHIEFQEKG